ncbi:MAG: EamA family transporter [Candidatus Bathyarchaeia archaeon]
MDKYTLSLVVVSIVGWGLWGLFAKVGMQAVGKYPHMLVTYLVGFLVLALIVGLFASANRFEVSFSPGFIYPLIAGVSMMAGTLAFFTALERAPLSIVAPLAALYPVLTVVLAVVFLHEYLKLVHVVGIGFALIAVYLLSS